ncbi:hypothetical protein CPB83DRAFT_839263 [Crepidotus variabilis]|uniref:Uncharacterized protein n=1 Tax=Crepidotus variabilis TaxID=179855 RepID=A0A9P6E7D7_9AGAR|nr:hypothetical protein CPB83DRAFT_839263 [Crepidotus variabilis]
MAALDVLKAEILTFTHTVNQSYDDKKAQKILDLVEAIPEDGSQSSSPTPPPLGLLVYAVKSILYPTVIYEQISDLVRLFTMIDFWRQRSMGEVKTAVIWDDYFASSGDKGQMPYTQLTDDVRGILLGHQEDALGWRRIFMRIVCKCFTTHLQRLWLNQRGASFRKQWEVYFSIATKHFVPYDSDNQQPDGQKPSQAVDLTHAFQYQLSVEDLDMLVESMQECREFMVESFDNAKAWATPE